MGFFSRKQQATALQIPDQLSEQARLQYGNGNFSSALESYGSAIDKIHTMCVCADRSSRIRDFSQQDQPILDGFMNSLGASLSLNPRLDVSETVEQTIGYLRQIAAEADTCGDGGGRYWEAVKGIETAYKLGTI